MFDYGKESQLNPEIKKVYLAGPMTGYEEYNYPAFEAAEKGLRALGYEVVSPREISLAHGSNDWAFCLKEDIRELVHCNAIVTLEGWVQSKGATLECYIAWRLKIPILRYPKLEVIEDVILEGYLCHGGRR